MRKAVSRGPQLAQDSGMHSSVHLHCAHPTEVHAKQMQIPRHEFWKRCADEATQLAQEMRTAQGCRQMLVLAEHYEMLAEAAQRRELCGKSARGGPPGKTPGGSRARP